VLRGPELALSLTGEKALADHALQRRQSRSMMPLQTSVGTLQRKEPQILRLHLTCHHLESLELDKRRCRLIAHKSVPVSSFASFIFNNYIAIAASYIDHMYVSHRCHAVKVLLSCCHAVLREPPLSRSESNRQLTSPFATNTFSRSCGQICGAPRTPAVIVVVVVLRCSDCDADARCPVHTGTHRHRVFNYTNVHCLSRGSRGGSAILRTQPVGSQLELDQARHAVLDQARRAVPGLFTGGSPTGRRAFLMPGTMSGAAGRDLLAALIARTDVIQ
jgi:hypothetical protein